MGKAIVQLVCLAITIIVIGLVILLLTGKIDPEDPFGGCTLHPGECGVQDE